MTFKRPYSAGLAALAVGLFAATAAYAEPTVNKGDTAWMMISTVLVLVMTRPGLALFYGGLVRAKNTPSVLAQVSPWSRVTVIWALYGYSLAFTDGDDVIGGGAKPFLLSRTPDLESSDFHRRREHPRNHLCLLPDDLRVAITPRRSSSAAWPNGLKFFGIVVFSIARPLLVYFSDRAHGLVLAGPDAIATHPTDAVRAGFIWGKGALDFAGGTVVHINPASRASMGAIVLGPRIGYRKEPMPPHSLTMTMIGAGLLWVGWFGFNAGSNLEANDYAGLAMANTFLAPRPRASRGRWWSG